MEEKISNEYTLGFNEGYIIAKHLPEVANSLSKIESPSMRIECFRDGQQQFVLEQIRELRIKGQDRNREKGNDKEFNG